MENLILTTDFRESNFEKSLLRLQNKQNDVFLFLLVIDFGYLKRKSINSKILDFKLVELRYLVINIRK